MSLTTLSKFSTGEVCDYFVILSVVLFIFLLHFEFIFLAFWEGCGRNNASLHKVRSNLSSCDLRFWYKALHALLCPQKYNLFSLQANPVNLRCKTPTSFQRWTSKEITPWKMPLEHIHCTNPGFLFRYYFNILGNDYVTVAVLPDY